MIETLGLRRVFKARRRSVEAVAGVDLAVQRGEIFGFLGPNGAGKTTTLRMLATLLPPSSGAASVAGYDLLRRPQDVRKRIGYVAQGGGSAPEISGRSELIFQARLYGFSHDQARQRAQILIDSLELSSCADRRVQTYSGGQRRRLDLAVGLIHEPSLVFLDEPTTGLDPQSRAHLWDEVRRLRERGMTIFLTTHYLEEADSLCDRLAIIDQGRIVAEGTPDALKRQVSGDSVVLAASDMEAALAVLRQAPFVRHAESDQDSGTVRLYVEHGEARLLDVLRLIEGSGLDLLSIAVSRPSLDDVFLRQTGRSLRDGAQ